MSSSTKRKSSHVSRACNNCRRRKSRCDGVRPSCGTCAVFQDECGWTEEEDRRRPVSREYVEALRTRVRALEALLDARSAQTAPHRSEQHLSDDLLTLGGPSSGIPTKVEPDAGESGLDNAMSRLVFDEASGELMQYGETSAMYHASRIGSSPTQDISMQPLGLEFDSPIVETSDGLDFLQFLPPGANLTAKQHDMLLDLHFCFFSSWLLRADRRLFYRDLRKACRTGGAAPLSHWSPLLHNTILALATAFSDDPDISSPVIRAAYGLRAKEAIDVERKRPTLATVLGLALLSSFYSGRAEHALGWLHFGTATRLCQTLGLNVDCEPLVGTGQISEGKVRERVGTFWTTYCQDKMWASWIGRQASIATQDSTTKLPKVDVEADMQPSLLSADSSSLLAGPSYVSSAFVASCTLCLLCARIMTVNYSVTSKSKNVEPLIADIRLALDDWLERLPATLAMPTQTTARGAPPAVIMLHLCFHWLVLLAHRPTATAEGPTSEAKEVAIKRCERSASRIILLWQLWRRLFGLRFVSISAVQIAFFAGSTHLQLGALAPVLALRRREEAVAQAREAVSILQEMSASWQSARQSADILLGLIDDLITGSIGGTTEAPSGGGRVEGATPMPNAGLSFADSPPAHSAVLQQSGPALPYLSTYEIAPVLEPLHIVDMTNFGAMHYDPLLGGLGLTGVDGAFSTHRLAREDFDASFSVPTMPFSLSHPPPSDQGQAEPSWFTV